MAPPAIGAIITGITIAVGSSATGALAWAIGIGTAALTYAVSSLNKIEIKNVVGEQTVQIKEPVAPWKTNYGLNRHSGNITHVGTTNEDNVFHTVVTLASHESQAIDGVYLNENPHYWNDLNSDYIHPESFIIIDGFASSKLVERAENLKAYVYMQDNQNRLAQFAYVAVQKSLGTIGLDDLDENGNGVWPAEVNEGDIPFEQFLSWKPSGTRPAIRLATDNVDESGWIKSSFQQRGHTKIYTKTRYSATKFSSGYPNYSVVSRGKKVLNLNTSVTQYSTNPSWCMYDYLTDSRLRGGMGVEAENIDSPSFVTAGSISDDRILKAPASFEFLSKEDYIENLFETNFFGIPSEQQEGIGWDQIPLNTSDVVDNEILIASPNDALHCPIMSGDGVRLSSTGTIPFGLSSGTTYYAIVTRWESHREFFLVEDPLTDSVENAGSGGRRIQERYISIHDLEDDEDKTYWRVQLATTPQNALLGIPITFTQTSPEALGTHTLTHYDEARYTLNGSYSTSMKPVDILSTMLSSMAGELYHSEGKWRVRAGAWVAPTIEFTEDDIVAPLSVITKVSASERINAVKGKYTSLFTAGQPSDYPSVENTLYLDQDNGVKQYGELDLFYTNSTSMAQRIAKIFLEQNRQEIVVETEFNLSGMQITAGDNIQLTFERFGWAQKEFNVREWELITNPDGISVRVLLQETASGIFDWNNGEETTIDLAPNTSLRSPFQLRSPANLARKIDIDNENYVDHAVAKVILQWQPPLDQEDFIDSYRVAYRLSSTELTDDDWIVNEVISGTNRTNVDFMVSTIFGLDLGFYDFSVTPISQEGIEGDSSVLSEVEVTIVGTTPIDVTNFTGVPLSGQALLEWDVSLEPEVLNGGSVVIRHTDAVSAGEWNDSLLMATLDGNTSSWDAPLKTGTYMIKFKNSTGGIGINASSFILTQDNTVAYGNITTISEQTGFLGDKNNCEVVDGKLKLTRI